MYKIDFHSQIHIHFIGIGGISMSGLAEIVLREGCTVSGSDRSISPRTDRLIALGATVLIGQSASHITDDISLVVYTAAIRPDNPEWQAARAAGIPMLSRAEFLGQLMRNYKNPIAVSGTHGKTSTTSMLAHILLAAETDPTVSLGGMLESIGGNIRVGESDLFLTEACEYTNSFLDFHPKYNIILNIEEEHMDFFKDIDDIRHSFRLFAKNTLPDGALILNSSISRPEEIADGSEAKTVMFGVTGSEDYSATHISLSDTACPSFTYICRGEKAGHVSLRVPGEHNISNALAAIACAKEVGIPDARIIKGLQSFRGTKRRFEYKGTYHGATVIDDYAHHPTEIRATLTAARNHPKERIVCVFQPHTYSRTKKFWDEFADTLSLADIVVLTDVYSARETDTLGVRISDLAEDIRKRDTECHYFPSFDDVKIFLSEKSLHTDMLITMGAGNVYLIGESLLSEN